MSAVVAVSSVLVSLGVAVVLLALTVVCEERLSPRPVPVPADDVPSDRRADRSAH